MATKRAVWNKFGRYFSACVIAAFFLPFFGVSCDGMDVVTVSGADMVGGCRPGGMITEAEDQQERQGHKRHRDDDSPDADSDTASSSHHHGGSMDMEVGNVSREPLVIVALVLAIGLFAASWLRKAVGAKASFGAAAALLVMLVVVYFKVGGELKDAVAEEAKNTPKSMAKDVHVSAGGRYGLWLEALLLGSILYMSGRAMREVDDGPSLPPAQALPPPSAPPPAA